MSNWSGGREARQGTANPSTRVQIPSRPPSLETHTDQSYGKVSAMSESTRPWGRYEILQESPEHKVKCIWVTPGKRISYQRHEKRAEHWFIIAGTARITVNGVESTVVAGDAVDIAIADLHRIENIGRDDVIFIEVQTGTYFGEDDIERIEDDFGRR